MATGHMSQDGNGCRTCDTLCLKSRGVPTHTWESQAPPPPPAPTASDPVNPTI